MSVVQGSRKESHVRVTSACNRLLRLPGATVIHLSFGGEGVIVTVRCAAAVGSADAVRTGGLEIHDRRGSGGGIWRSAPAGA